MTNLNAAAIDAAVIALKVHGGFDETETDDDPIWREEAETAVSAYLAALPEGSVMVSVVDIACYVDELLVARAVPTVERLVEAAEETEDWLVSLCPIPADQHPGEWLDSVREAAR